MTTERRDVFRIPGYRAYWSAYTVSGFGSYVTTLALQVLVLITLDGTATDAGLLNGARWLAYLALGLVAGALVDRRRRRPVMIGTDLARAAVLAVIPVLYVLDRLTVPIVIVFVAFFGLFSLFGDAAAQSFLPRVVPRTDLLAAHARTDQSDAVGQTTGPLVAGGLVTLVGAPFAVVVDAASYLFSALAIWRIRVREPDPGPMSGRGLRREIGDGLRWVYRHRVLTPMVIGAHGWFLFNSVLGTVYVSFTLLALHLSGVELGITLAAAGAAALVGSSLSTRTGLRWGAGRAIIASNLVMTLGWIVIALVPAAAGAVTVAVLAAGQALYGFGLGLSNANEMGYRQSITPDQLQGRMNTTIRSANRAMIVIGAPVGGVLAMSIGYRPTLWIAIVGFLLVAGYLTASPVRGARHGDS